MALDTFLKIDGIEGESVVKGMERQIEVLSWSWGMTQQGSAHSGTGAGTGKVNVQDLHFTKVVDKGSPLLMKLCCNGKHLKDAVVTMRKAGDNPVDFVKITLTNVLVSSVSSGGEKEGDQLIESVSLNFSEFRYEYKTQTKDGKAGPAVTTGFNIATNATTA